MASGLPEPQQAAQTRTLRQRRFHICEFEVLVELTILCLEDGSTALYGVGLCGRSRHAQTTTLQPHPCLTREQIEKDLHAFCEDVAHATAGRERLRLVLEQLE